MGATGAGTKVTSEPLDYERGIKVKRRVGARDEQIVLPFTLTRVKDGTGVCM